MKKVFILLLCLVLLFAMSGCYSKVQKITDMEKYSTMTLQTDSIEVEFDNNSGAPFNFTITDQEQITRIMQIIFDTPLQKSGKTMPPGDNTNFTVIQGVQSYRMHFRMNKQGKYYYAFSTNELQQALREIAMQMGAYDGVN